MDFGGFDAITIDESMSAQAQGNGGAMVDTVMGPNNVRTTWTGSPTKSLVILWFVVLAVYWGLGYFFRKQR